MESFPALAARLPDLPRWVEVRGCLLAGRGELLGLREQPALSFVLRDPDGSLLMVVRQPEPRVLAEAAARCVPGAELICAPEDADRVAAALRAWRRGRAVLHLLRDPSRLPAPDEGVRLLEPAEIDVIQVPDALRRELEGAVAEGAPIAAAWADGHPVSFCYAGSVTETLWDISIDTLAAHRRRGHAGRCVAHLVRHMQARGRQPVWGAAEDNPPSWRLARALGFAPVDELGLFQAPEAPFG